MNKRFELRYLKDFGDERSSMCVIEAEKELPFKIARFFYDFASKDVKSIRGNHANKNSKFAFISLAGQCKVEVDDGSFKEEFILNNPNEILIIDKLVWKKMYEFSSDSILLVISDSHYDKGEYIYDYSNFINLLKSNGEFKL